MDFPTLMVFRAASRECYDTVTAVLKAAFRWIVRQRVPDLEMFLYAMDETHTIIAGYAALAFFSRTEHSRGLPLQLFVPSTLR